jgi:transposase
MRRSFDSLAMMAQCVIKQDPLTGHLFVFRNKRGNCLKLLYWDRDGYAIWYKRLEKGNFTIPVDMTEDCRLEHYQLSMMLEGIDFTKSKRKKRFSLSVQNTSKHGYG